MNDKIVKRYSLSKQVSDQLERMIAAGEYAVGERIPTEPELMEMFEVSRNTVREAVRALSSAGVLEVKQGDGTYVCASNRFDANMSMKYAEVSLDDIREARNSIEVTIAYLASQRRTASDLAEIAAALKKRQGLEAVTKENTLADIEFHTAIAKACHNQILIDLYLSISSYLESHIAERQLETSLNAAVIDAMHENLYLAIRQKDPELAKVYAADILKI